MQRRYTGALLLLTILLAFSRPVHAFEGAGLPIASWWVYLPLVLALGAAALLLRNEPGRDFLRWTLLGLIVLVPTAMGLISSGSRFWLLGAAMIVLSPWLILLALMMGLWRNEAPAKPTNDKVPKDSPNATQAVTRDSPDPDAADFPATRPFDRT